ncbi:hypothetical protein [Microbacterium sp. CCH5-D1]|uniref:hypothetical protein n=1 Tax=Microbacterium sp. CCH5-D1 TaxID=1768780 RepID=UPI000769B0B5|nr:hypothetical protein [Microbacterium sp. CCH5-D1]
MVLEPDGSMIPLKRPVFGVKEILAAIGGGARTSRVSAAEDTLLRHEERLRSRADASTWYTMPRGNRTVTSELADDIRYVYRSKLANKKGNARLYYNRLRASSPRSKCPICMERQVAALDHYLPKELWPGLAIVPDNLYPICTTCNHRKSSYFAGQADEQYLHPYFDDLGDSEWISARVVEEPGAPVRFAISAPEEWSDELAVRVRTHYERFKLFELYEDNAADLLADYVLLLDETFDRGDTEGVSVLLADQARSMRHARLSGRGSPSRWPYLAMQAWADSEWFAANAGWRV